MSLQESSKYDRVRATLILMHIIRGSAKFSSLQSYVSISIYYIGRGRGGAGGGKHFWLSYNEFEIFLRWRWTNAEAIAVQDYVLIKTRTISRHSLECDSSITVLSCETSAKSYSFSTFLSVHRYVTSQGFSILRKFLFRWMLPLKIHCLLPQSFPLQHRGLLERYCNAT